MKTSGTSSFTALPQRSTAVLVTLFLCPGLLIYTVFMVWPVAQAAMFSFFDWNGFGWPRDFSGFRNFVSVLRDPLFWKAFGNNLYLIVFMMATVVPIALGLSVVIARRIPFAITFRLIFFLPYVLADLTAGLIWRYLLDGDYGMLSEVSLFGLDQAYVLANPQLALTAVAVVMVWKSFGFHLILFVAGLQQIDRALYEAAEIDGAGPFQRLTRITIPLLAPTIALSGFFVVISSIQAFDMIMAMTTGGPSRSTSTMVHYLYADGIASMRIGFGSAIGVVIFFITLAFSTTYRKLSSRYA